MSALAEYTQVENEIIVRAISAYDSPVKAKDGFFSFLNQSI